MTITFRERITCTVGEACSATGLGRTKLYQLIKCRRIATTKVGSRTLINVGSLISAVGGAHDRGDGVGPDSDSTTHGTPS
jgi:excisionase family DNA binding protein